MPPHAGARTVQPHPSAQAAYFDESRHRFHVGRLLDPDTASLIELDTLQRHAGLRPGATVIDFGCGNGRVSLHFLRAGYHVIAVDISEKSLQELEDTYAAGKQASWGRLTARTTLPRVDVDGIVGADVLHHIDVPVRLPELRARLRPGGALAFSEPNGFYPAWYLFLLLERMPWRIERGMTRCTSGNLTRQLRQAGFNRVTVRGHGVLPTRVFNATPGLARMNALIPERVSLMAPCAFRLMVTARR